MKGDLIMDSNGPKVATLIKGNGEIINFADIISAIYDAANGVLKTNTDMQTTLNFEKFTVTSSVVKTFTPSKIIGATKVLITVETGDIRYKIDGGDPTLTDGHYIFADSPFTLESEDQLSKFKCIALTVAATLQCTFGK